MKASIVRVRLLALAALAAVAACGPSDVGSAKLKGVEHGTPRTALLERIGTGPLTAKGVDEMRLVNGHLHQVFLSRGETYEVIWYRETPGALGDSLTRETVTPIVLHADTVEGWGWKFYDKRSAEANLPHPYRASPTAQKNAPPPETGPAPAMPAPTPAPPAAPAPAPDAPGQKKS